MKRKIAAIMAADVAGYSRLVAEDEDEALARLISYREIFSDFVGRGGGRIFNTAGDAVLAEFTSSVDALRAALDIQESIRTRNADVPENRRMRFRIGMTVGDVIEREGDLLGDAVNVAARLEGLAAPGGICISRSLQEQVANKVAISFRDLGLQHVKNIPNPVHAFTVLGSEPNLASPGRTSQARRFALPLLTMALLLAALCSIWKLHLQTRASASRFHVEQSTSNVATEAVDSLMIYGPVFTAAPPVANDDFKPLGTPFICDACRENVKTLTSLGPNSAVALTAGGNYGAVSQRDTAGRAEQDALDACNGSSKRACQVYELNGKVVIPGAVPMPPEPWVSPSMRRTSFDPDRIGLLTPDRRDRLRSGYLLEPGPKALALGANGSWGSRYAAANESEAIRASLESCGWHSNSPCRVIAVNNEFVVEATNAPVDLLRKPLLLAKEPQKGALDTDEVVLIDDGACPVGQVKELTGGNSTDQPRKRRCIARPRL